MKKQNTALAKEFGIDSFPTVLILDSKGKELARTGYVRGGPARYKENLETIRNKIDKSKAVK